MLLLGCLPVFLVMCRSSSYILDMNPLVDINIADIFAHGSLPFHSLYGVFDKKKVPNSNVIQFIRLFLIVSAYCVLFRKLLLIPV